MLISIVNAVVETLIAVLVVAQIGSSTISQIIGLHAKSAKGEIIPQSPASKGTLMQLLQHIPPPCFLHLATTMLPQSWFPDTGASHHATPDLTTLGRNDDCNGNDKLVVGSGKGLPIHHTGS